MKIYKPPVDEPIGSYQIQHLKKETHTLVLVRHIRKLLIHGLVSFCHKSMFVMECASTYPLIRKAVPFENSFYSTVGSFYQISLLHVHVLVYTSMKSYLSFLFLKDCILSSCQLLRSCDVDNHIFSLNSRLDF